MVYKLDQKDRKILDILSTKARAPLRDIAKEIGLSIDSVHKRIKKMEKEKVFSPSVILKPKTFGYPLATQAHIKFKNITSDKVKKFVAFLRGHPNVITAISTMGEWDFVMVLIADKSDTINKISMEIREKFSDIIATWASAITLEVYKYDKYKVTELK